MMNLQEINDKLIAAGLNVANDKQEPATLYHAEPSYRENYGFYFISAPNFQAIILKGVYKDFLRVLEGKCPIEENDLNEVVKTLNTAESTFKAPLKITFFIDSGICYIKSAEMLQYPHFNVWRDNRDYMLPRPLTKVEYILPASKLYDETVMVSGGYFTENFPFLMSPFTESVFAKIPDILNPIFVSSNLKTSSPSTLNVYNRLFINMSLYEKMMKAIGLGNHMFRLKFSPHLYIKQNNAVKAGSLNKSYFPIEDAEINDIITEMARTAAHINSSSIAEDSLFEYPVQLTIAYQYIDIKLQDCLVSLLKTFPDLPSLLQAVYKTRENSIFYSGEKTIALCLDFASPKINVNFNTEKNIDKIDKYISALPFFKRVKSSGHIKKIIKYIHKLLDMRDNLFLAASDFIIKSNNALLQIGDIALSKGKADNKEDIFYFEQEEVRKIYNDSFFSDATQSINFRKWQLYRYGAQPVPPEIYGSDFEKCSQIAETMIIKYSDLAEYDVLPLNKGEFSGIVTKNLCLENFENKIIAAKSLYLADLPRFVSSAGFILENASPFGFAAEFAVINNIPLYTGLRFAPLILDRVKAKTAGNKIIKI